MRRNAKDHGKHVEKSVSRHQGTHPLPGSRGQNQGALHGSERIPSLARIDAPNKPSLSFITRIQLNYPARPIFLTFPHCELAAPAPAVVRKVQLRLWTRKLSHFGAPAQLTRH